MLKPVVAVFDSAIQAYAPPIIVQARGAAVRSFVDEVNRKDANGNNPLNSHASDFELRILAMFDENTGIYHALPEGPEVLARGKDVLQSS